jgi:hypothetical protein
MKTDIEYAALLVQCAECGFGFDKSKSIGAEICDSCRMKMAPCLECGANDEYEAGEICHCAGDKDSCHGTNLWP